MKSPSSLIGVPRFVLLAAAVVLIAAGIAGVLTRTDDLPADVPVVPTPPGEVDRDIEPLADPYAWDPARRRVRAPRGGGQQPRAVRALAGRRGRQRRADRALAPARRARRRAGRRRRRHRSKGWCSSRAPGRPDARAPGGLEGAAGSRRSSPRPAATCSGCASTWRQPPLHAPLARAERRGRERAGRAPAPGARPGRRALRPRAGARRHRPLPEHRQRALRPRGPGVRLLPHGHRQPRERAARLRRTRLPYVQRLLRLHADPPRARVPAARGLGDDSSNYWWKLLAAREIMRLWREDRAKLDRLAALHAAKASAEEVLHPQADTPRFATPAELRARLGRGRRSCRSRRTRR